MSSRKTRKFVRALSYISGYANVIAPIHVNGVEILRQESVNLRPKLFISIASFTQVWRAPARPEED
jgi:hypothetical protein